MEVFVNLKKLFLALCLCVSSSFSYSYTAFPFMTGDKTFALNPFLYFDGKGAVGHDIFLLYGINPKVDVWSQISMVSTDQGTVTDWSTMLRYDLGNSNIVAVRASQWYVAPQYHLVIENDKFGFQANVAAQFSFEDMKNPAIYAVLSSLVKLFDGKMDVFVEANPGYYLKDGDFANLWVRPEGFGLDLTAGVGLSVGKALVSIACPIYDVTHDATPTFGMWWFFPIISN